MELLIITAAREFEKDIKLLLKKAQVKAFSYLDVTGYKDVSNEPMSANWFASSAGEHQSVLFYAFVQKDLVKEVMVEIKEVNSRTESLSKVHVAVMDIKTTNELW